MKILKPIFAIFSLLAAFILVACSSSTSSTSSTSSSSSATSGATARTLEEIKESGTIKIGVFSDKKPFGYVDENGNYQGYDIYLGNRLAKELGVEVEYVPVEAANRVEYLTSAKVDLILANFTVTEERKEQVDFALPYMKVSLGIVSPSSAVITDPEQLNGKTLIVSKGTTAELYFEENYPEVKLQKYNQYSEAYAALLDGRGDAMSTDNTEVLAWALENKGFEVGVKTLGEIDTIAPAVQKGNTELLDFINKTIEKLGQEEFFHKAYEETLQPVYGDAAQADDLVIEGGVIK
ncbi:TPA: cysteine ABC transporter substrate-binding protein [Streptococcus suis]